MTVFRQLVGVPWTSSGGLRECSEDTEAQRGEQVTDARQLWTDVCGQQHREQLA